MNTISNQCYFKKLGFRDYSSVWQDMLEFTNKRDGQTVDEIWFVEHPAIFTQGQAGKSEHLLAPGAIPVIQVDRGGQVTYHGPGQQVVYFLVDLKRKKLGVRQLVSAIENSVVELLSTLNIVSSAKPDAPGVYVEDEKICSLGLKIRRGCSFHGLALNVNMDLEPFSRINPCGYEGLEVTQVSALSDIQQLGEIELAFQNSIVTNLNYLHSSTFTKY